MANRLLLIMTNAAEGKEEALAEWYRGTHLADMVALPGVETAQLYELDPHPAEPPLSPFRFLAVYEIPEEHVQAAKDALAHAKAERPGAIDAGRRPILPSSPGLGAEPRIGGWYTPVTDVVHKPGS